MNETDNVISLKLRTDSSRENSDALCRNFSSWLRAAKTGDRYCYYFGYCIVGSSVGRLAFEAYEDGSVTLFQKREGLKFGYWAERLR